MAKSAASVSIRYDGDGKNKSVSVATGFRSTGKGRTQQQFRDQCDINNIMKKYKLADLKRATIELAERWGRDLASVPDFHTAMNTVAKATEAFASMPADIRKRCNNDPAEFLDFVRDPKNESEFIRFGVVVPVAAPKAPEPVLVRVLEPATPPAVPPGNR